MKSLVFFALTALSAVHAACPGLYHEIGNGCYNFPEESNSWLNSNQICQFIGGYLAKIGSAAQQSALKRYYDTYLRDGSKFVNRWIGASDSLSEGTWRWVPGGATLDFNNWQKGLPSNSSMPSFDCAFWDAVNNVWRDQECCTTLNNTAPLCETDRLHN